MKKYDSKKPKEMKTNQDSLIEESFKLLPKTIYKIRDWNSSQHKTIITEQSIWFASPKDLNDPFDIRIPMKIDLTEIEDPIFKLKLKKSLILKYSNSSFPEEQIDFLCERKLIEIKKDPKNYFYKNYKDMREGTFYDVAGVFSCTTDELNSRMWKEYGNNHKGFSVGFDTFELFKTLQCLYSLIEYNNEIPLHTFLKNESDFDFRDFFLKSTKWKHEKEFRFFCVISKESDRRRKYTENSVREFLLGAKFPESNKLEFINQVRNNFKTNIPIYQLNLLEKHGILQKYRVN